MASHGELPISSHAHIRCRARLSLHRPTTLGSPAPENRNRATTHAHMLLRRPYQQRGNATLPVERHDAMSAMSERAGHEVPDRGADRRSRGAPAEHPRTIANISFRSLSEHLRMVGMREGATGEQGEEMGKGGQSSL